MNKRQIARLNRHGKVRVVLTEFDAVVQATPALLTRVSAYRALLAPLPNLEQAQQRRSLRGITELKDLSESGLIARLVKSANALNLFYEDQTPADLAAARALHLHKSDYDAFTDEELLTEARDVNQQVQAHATALATGYNLPVAYATALSTLVASFGDQKPAPKSEIGKRKVNGETLRRALKAADDYLTVRLLNAAKIVMDTAPDFYARLVEAARIDDIGGAGKPKMGAPSAGGQ